ncbi:hypothetical protein [Candidatus Gromoviella agglomerans]|uniref:hypothetical protein n=1 Tax=Candidatus Gromoviella agglomerans TaxID=2806609 RepID=UPI001E454CBA|nr:hypothetical protein [Candidatus Gromoviella agglomerans]UFX98610.1 Trigger factor [Candidatus Gromoviella agglomerans]
MKVLELKKDKLSRIYLCSENQSALNQAVDLYLLQMSSRIPGFRKVKSLSSLSTEIKQARIKALREKLASNISSICLEKLHDIFVSSIKDCCIDEPAYDPEISLKTQNDSEVIFEASFETFANDMNEQIKIPCVKKYIAKINEQDTQEIMEKEAKNQNVFEKAEEGYEMKEDDTAIIDMSVVINGKENELLTKFHTEKGNFVKDIQEKLIGAKKGQEILIDIAIPPDFLDKIFKAGLPHVSKMKKFMSKPLQYKIFVHEIRKRKVFKIDDEFATHLGFEKLEDLIKNIETKLSKRAEQISNTLVETEVINYLNENLTFDVPSKLLQHEKEFYKNKTQANKSKDNENSQNELDQNDEKKIDIDKIALQNVRFNTLMQRYINKHAQITQQEMRIMNYITKGKYNNNQIYHMISRDKFMQYLISNIEKFDEEEVSFNKISDLASQK